MGAFDQDLVFSGVQKSSTPKELIAPGEVSRLINSRFVEGAISNGLGFDEYTPQYSEGPNKRVFASKVTYQQLLTQGDVQLVAPLHTLTGKFQIQVVSGVLFLIDLRTKIAYDITPTDAMLPERSVDRRLSFLDNSGGVYGAGGYQVIFNYPNLPIFISMDGARVSNIDDGEMPVARLGTTAGNRCFIISGDNILWASDPLGGAESLAPLTFTETYGPGGFTGQIFSIGSALDVQYVTALCRLPKFLGANQPFLAQNLLASSMHQKNVIAAGLPREAWQSSQFITYAGTGDGVAGPNASDNIGDNLVYVATSGQIKTLSQDQIKETSLVETFLDDGLGQYTCCLDANYWHKPWYEKLDHSYSLVKFSRNRLFASVFPVKHPAIGKYGQKQYTPGSKALAVASLDSETLLGPQASFAWEGFYDWCNPVGLITLGDDFYITSKDSYGRIRYFKSHFECPSSAVSTIITRGYFTAGQYRSRSINSGYLYFRYIPDGIQVAVSQLINDQWSCLAQGPVCDRKLMFSSCESQLRSEAGGVPLKIDVFHNGCKFELQGVKLNGEYHLNT